jgi:hypothetical protein
MENKWELCHGNVGLDGQRNIGRAYQLVQTNPRLSLKWKGFGVMGKLARIMIDVIQARIAMFRQRGATSPTKQGWAYQGHNLHSGIMKEFDTIMCLFNGPKELEDSQMDSKSSRQLQGYTNVIHASNMEPSRWDPWKRIIATMFLRNNPSSIE